jgi:hypothetical protein
MAAEPEPSPAYVLEILDIDGHKFSTSDGHITTIVLTGESQVDRAREVGERVPEYCLGNPDYRMITVIELASTHTAPVRAMIKAVARHRVEAEAAALQSRYDRAGIKANARDDVFAAIDFDGSISAHLEHGSAAAFETLVLGPGGKLLKRWTSVPTREELDSILKRSAQ